MTDGNGNPVLTTPILIVDKVRDFYRDLDAAQQAWWNNAANAVAVRIITDYLNENSYSDASKDFVIGIIDENIDNNLNSYPGKDVGLMFQWWLNDNEVASVLQDAYESWREISEKEKELVRSFPDIAYRFYKNRNIAFQKTNEYFGNSQGHLNGKADAFRHAFYQAINAVKDRKYFTKLFANAHESEVPQRWIKEKQMDLFNNEVGMDYIVYNNPNLSDVNQIATGIYNLLISGELVYLSPINYSDPAFWDNTLTSLPNDGNHGINNATIQIPTNQ